MGPGALSEGAIVSDLNLTLARFRADPRAAFGLAADADPVAIRAAFMALCKRYHPAKYARYLPATVRLANETFLVMRRAYDELLRAARLAPARAPAVAPPIVSPPRPAVASPAAVPAPPSPPRPAVASPAAVPNATPARTPAPRPPPQASSPAARIVKTPPRGVPVGAAPQPTGAAPASPGPPPAPRPGPQGSSARAAALRTAPHGVPVAPPAAEPTAVAAPAPTRGPSRSPKIDSPPPPDPRFARALEHLRERRWADARPILSELAAAAPGEARYRGYLHYLRGWEAFELGKDGEARAEWRRALACDAGLGMAQWALTKTGLG